MSVLTAPQINVLCTARDKGYALADTEHRSLAGGARRRMLRRLVDRGLLRGNRFTITQEGLEAIRAFTTQHEDADHD